MRTKRIFDLIFAFIGLIFCFSILFFIYGFACLDTKSNGFFFQKRIGQFGKPFVIVKLKTINPTTKKISTFGRFLRNTKLDEWPQLWNVLIGDMSFVGPRPDIAGYYDKLKGEDRKILGLKPGITSEASIKYRNEEVILSQQQNPLQYNDEVIFPVKVKMNLEYYYNRSFWGDLVIIWKTVFEG